MHNLTKATYFAHAMSAYNNPSCAGIHEFHEDVLRLKYVKRLIHRYARTGDVPVRLLMNHIIAIYNVFQPTAIAQLLFFRMDTGAWSAMKTMLEYLNLMPEEVPPVDGVIILNTNIPRDLVLLAMIEDTVDPHAATR